MEFWSKVSNLNSSLNAVISSSPALTCLLQVLNADIVHGEESCRGSVLRTHVGDGGSVSNGQLSHARAEELHKLPDDSHLSQVLWTQGRLLMLNMADLEYF